jgi:hypothetical protein
MTVDEKARLRPNSWSSLEVRLVDVSAAGFRAECEARVLPGSAIWIDLPGVGEVEAQVSWRRDGELGARFVVPLDPARCTLKPVSSEARLARLLVQRADARSSGRYRQEHSLREQILSALPMHKVER